MSHSQCHMKILTHFADMKRNSFQRSTDVQSFTGVALVLLKF